MSDRMEQNLFRYIWSHSKRQQIWILIVVALSMPTYFLAFDIPKLIVNGPIQGRGFETPDATQKVLADRDRQSVRRPVLHAVQRLRTRPHGRADRAQRRVPGLCHHQRRLQALHQHLQGPARRAHASPPALPACGPGAALPVPPIPAGAQFRDRDHDQGRGRPAGRLHRRSFRYARLPGRPGACGAALHHAAELGAGSGHARNPDGADLAYPQAAGAVFASSPCSVS